MMNEEDLQAAELSAELFIREVLNDFERAWISVEEPPIVIGEELNG